MISLGSDELAMLPAHLTAGNPAVEPFMLFGVTVPMD